MSTDIYTSAGLHRTKTALLTAKRALFARTRFVNRWGYHTDPFKTFPASSFNLITLARLYPRIAMQNSAIRSASSKVLAQQFGIPAEDACAGSLRSLIESQIIPRLLEAHPHAGAANSQNFDLSFKPAASDVATFSELCVSREPEDVLTFVEGLLLNGVNSDSIFLDLIAPAARHLGLMWEQERTDFTQVTLGLLRMHQVTHRIGFEYQSGPQNAGTSKRIMLASAPGSQHILGLAMASEFFRKSGWQVVVEIANTPSELYAAAKNEWFDLIGLSVSLTQQFGGLLELVTTLKQTSCNPSIPILLGGPAFFSGGISAQSLGADAIATDALEGVRIASLLVNS
ncbi:cobalamin B12-binding domain-containing protein [Rhodoferax antarcticus]|uniref:cobalamin B12-binding domain-containing protein n=1 Tax=Rhodoferax antarcticus TaxID=81479 RepID=UPI001F5162AE|nr:cobalamin B12-binding domain-containing protein [Rhodoferax antarcticus]